MESLFKIVTEKMWFSLLLVCLPMILGVDLDYLSPVLREQTVKCQSILHQLYCHMKCGQSNAICSEGNCFCVSDAVVRELKGRHDEENEKYDDLIDFTDNGDYDNDDKTRIDSIPLYALRPTVRHHIAHFCPNLDIARDCIKKCMPQGKPAFCGKDHVCYCGHKYSHTNDKSKTDVKAIYAQFHDLYTKYFGPQSREEAEKSTEE